MATNRNPAAGDAAGAQVMQLADTTMVARCRRCGHRSTTQASIEVGLGCDCRKRQARIAGIADRLIELAGNVDALSWSKLRTVSKALDQIEVSR